MLPGQLQNVWTAVEVGALCTGETRERKQHRNDSGSTMLFRVVDFSGRDPAGRLPGPHPVLGLQLSRRSGLFWRWIQTDEPPLRPHGGWLHLHERTRHAGVPDVPLLQKDL
ncbi:hypothetical protein TNCV_2555791 [Trichonephila clavipes]|nr:hypothetical protein TNCV_2555791 [Trichonephila clavipes]